MARSGDLCEMMLKFAWQISNLVLREIAAVWERDSAASRPSMEAVVEMLQRSSRSENFLGLQESAEPKSTTWRNAGVVSGTDIRIEKDTSKTLQIYDKTAEAADSQAQCTLGLYHRKGTRVTKDASKSAELYRSAATSGYSVLQGNRGDFTRTESKFMMFSQK